MYIGSHVSMAKGLLGAAEEAASYGANAMMVYTGPPQNTRRSPLENLKIPEGRAYMRERGIERLVVHAPYIINLGSPEDSKFRLAVDMLKDELARTAAFGSDLLVVHPGAYTSSDLDLGIRRISDGLNEALSIDNGVCVCLETMAGKGTEIGGRFEELARIIDLCGSSVRDMVKVCFDTCHTHDSGYDVANGFDAVMAEFGETVGHDRLAVFHLNGSLNPRGSRKDRHANLGAGADNPKGADNIGFEAICRIAHSKYAEGRPLILETPWLDEKTNLYKEEIAALREGKL